MPADPYVTGAAIMGGANLIGSWLGNRTSSNLSGQALDWEKTRWGLEKEMYYQNQYTIDRRLEEARTNTRNDMMLGNNLDITNQKHMFDYKINRGIQSGMTPYEMFMGPAAGSSGGTTNSGATLGNAASQQGIAAAQQHLEAYNAMQQRNTQLAQTRMQVQGQQAVARQNTLAQLGSALLGAGASAYGSTKSADATTKAAEIGANANRYQTDITKQIADNRLKLDQKTFDEVTLPAAAAQIGKTEQETKVLINEAITSTPEFQKQMKKWSMGVDNMMVEYFIKEYGIDIMADEKEYSKIPKNKRADFLAAVMSYQSNITKEAEGIRGLDIIQGLGSILGNASGSMEQAIKGIDLSLDKPERPGTKTFWYDLKRGK